MLLSALILTQVPSATIRKEDDTSLTHDDATNQ